MMYVKERRVDSICDTWLAFLVMKSSYLCSHFGGTDATLWSDHDDAPGASGRTAMVIVSHLNEVAFG